MKRLVVKPPDPGVQLQKVDDPSPGPGEVLLETLEVGVDGTDQEIVRAEYGTPPPGEEVLTIGHEALARVLEVPDGSRLQPGDLVNPTVRRGCGLCLPCKSGQSDFCFTGLYRERGIKQLHGYNSDYFTETEEYLVKAPESIRDVAVLTEPLSIMVKAMDQVLKVQERMPWKETRDLGEKKGLVAGSGSVGLMATFILRHQGAEVITMDRSPDDTPKAKLIERLGAHHLNSKEHEPAVLAEDFDGFDIIVEATGAPQVPFQLATALATNGIMVLLGVPGKAMSVEVRAAAIMKEMVLENQVLFGCVNSNATHFEEAHDYLAGFLERYPREIRQVISHRHPAEEYEVVFGGEDRGKELIKDVLVWKEA